MRLLHVVPTYLPAVRYGGPIYSVHGLCTALAARGHDVHVFTTSVDGPANSDVPVGTPVAMDGVTVWYFTSTRMRRLYWSPPLRRALSKAVRGFDLLHLHSVFLWPTWAAARAARRAAVPYVISPRGMLVKSLLRARSPVAKTAWITLIERANLAQAAGIHLTSPLERNDFEEFGFRTSGRIFDVPNGIELKAQLPNRPAQQPPYLVMLGRISWKKRIDFGLEVLKLVEGITLVIAGTEEGDGLAMRLRERAKALGLGERVVFTGPVEGSQKRELLQRALALLMPSLSENFGNAALEAMAEGTPVLTVPQVGIADVVNASGGGFVMAPDPEAFARVVHRLRDDPDLRLRAGRQARAMVVQKFSWEVVAERMEREYRKTIDSFSDGA